MFWAENRDDNDKVTDSSVTWSRDRLLRTARLVRRRKQFRSLNYLQRKDWLWSVAGRRRMKAFACRSATCKVLPSLCFSCCYQARSFMGNGEIMTQRKRISHGGSTTVGDIAFFFLFFSRRRSLLWHCLPGTFRFCAVASVTVEVSGLGHSRTSPPPPQPLLFGAGL